MRVDVVDFLEELGVKNVQVRGEEAYYSCPFDGHSGGDKNPSASMNLLTGGFFCFGCGRKGNTVSFLAELEGVSPIKASRWIRERFGSEIRKAPDSVEERVRNELEGRHRIRRQAPPIPYVPEAEIKTRLISWTAVQRAITAGEDVHECLRYPLRRFSAEMLEEWEFGYDPVSRMVCFPYRHHEDGRLIGIKGRAWWPDAMPKYQVLGNKYGPEGGKFTFPTLDISRVVFGGHRGFDPGRPVYVTEGELNSIAVWGHGYQSVGQSGRYMSREQMKIVCDIADRVVLVWDEIEDAMAIARELSRKIAVDIVPEHDRDPADMSTEEFRDLVGRRKSFAQMLLT